jgi:hypothetical protein
MKKFLSTLLNIFGFIFLLTALISGYYAVTSFLERLKWGRGVFFTDVEIFSAITIVFIILGIIILRISHKLKKKLPSH